MAAAVIAVTISACLPSRQESSANGGLSCARAISARPKMMVSTATIFGRKPEPGIDSCPVGRSPLSAMTSAPKATKPAPATWSERRVMMSSRVSWGAARLSSLPSDRDHRLVRPLAVDVPEFLEVRAVEVVEFLPGVGQGGLELLGMRRLIDGGAQRSDDRRRR